MRLPSLRIRPDPAPIMVPIRRACLGFLALLLFSAVLWGFPFVLVDECRRCRIIQTISRRYFRYCLLPSPPGILSLSLMYRPRALAVAAVTLACDRTRRRSVKVTRCCWACPCVFLRLSLFASRVTVLIVLSCGCLHRFRLAVGPSGVLL